MRICPGQRGTAQCTASFDWESRVNFFGNWMMAAVLALPLAAQAGAPLANERERISYMVGMDVGSDPGLQAVAADIDMEALGNALVQGFAGNPPQLPADQMQATSAALAARMSGQGAGTEISKPLAGTLVGSNIARSLMGLREEIDPAAFLRGLQVRLQKGTAQLGEDELAALRVRLNERMKARAEALGEENRRAGEAFLAANRQQAGVVTTRSGLQYQVLVPGNGARPLPTDRVRVHYEGKLLDGTVFDSSLQRGEPTEFGLNQVIPGWTEGVGLMAAGAKYRFWIPGDLAYGRRGAPPHIGPNQTLVFDVQLLDVLK